MPLRSVAELNSPCGRHNAVTRFPGLRRSVDVYSQIRIRAVHLQGEHARYRSLPQSTEQKTLPSVPPGHEESSNYYFLNADGLQYQASEKLILRTGFSAADEPCKNVNTLFNLLAPSTVKKHASLGASYNFKNQSRINFVCTLAFKNTIEGTSTFTGPQTGYVRMRQDMMQISYSRNTEF